jgi:hypothetical protein
MSDPALSIPTIDRPPVPSSHGRRRRWAGAAAIALIVLFLAAITVPGVAYRRWVWDFTEPGRFRGDISRNFRFGVQAIDDGFLNLYEDQLRDDPPYDRKVDYPPLRLATFQAWAAWNLRVKPEERAWKPTYAFTAPLMRYYTALEWAAALAALLIVRHWLRRCAADNVPATARHPLPLAGPRAPPSPWTGLSRGMAAFAILWFDPGVAIIAHGWPSPNMWVIPFYLWTCLLCLWDRWFLAGLVMAAGAMMQGQQMFVAGLFVLWPLLGGRPALAFRWVAGFALGFMAIAGGWMLSVRPDPYEPVRHVNWPAVMWVASTLGWLTLVGLHDRIRLLREHKGWPWVLVGLTLIFSLIPAVATRNVPTIAVTFGLLLLLVGAFWRFQWRTKRYLLALTAAGCLLACVPFFGASTAWWQVGFLYGAERFTNVGGELTNNLGSILHFHFGWREINDTCFTLAPGTLFGWPTEPTTVNIRQVLVTVYAIFFLASAAAVAVQWRRRDANLLVALVLPWALFFTLMPQMSPRYAVFAAGVGAICVGRSVGLSLMVLLVFSTLTVEQTALCMMWVNGSAIAGDGGNALFNHDMRELFEQINPGPSWAVLLATGVLLWMAFTRSRERPKPPHDAGAHRRPV